MTYRQALEAAWVAGGADGALEFLRRIFHDPANQAIKGKATDYLHDDDDDDDASSRSGSKEKTLAEGFDQLVRLFVPKKPLAERVDNIVEWLERDPSWDERHRVQPFNALKLTVQTYERGSASLDSIHYDAKTKKWKKQYGLNHEVIYDDDAYDAETDDDGENSYDFIYAFEHKKQYQVVYEGEKLKNAELYRDVRVAQHARYAATIVDALFADKRFAEFPKQLPFSFFVALPNESSYEAGSLKNAIVFHAPIDAAALAGHPLREVILASAKPLPEPSPEERWVYAMRYLDQPESAEYETLLALTRESAAFYAATRELAAASLRGGRSGLEGLAARAPLHASPPLFVDFMFKLGPNAIDDAKAFAREVMQQPIPELPRKDIQDAAELSTALVASTYATWEAIPEAHRESLASSFATARGHLASASHPVLKVLAMEAELAREHGEDAISIDDEYETTVTYGDKVPADYIEAVGAVLDEMSDTFQGYGNDWSFGLERLKALGTRAKHLTPRVLDLLNRYCGGESRNGQLLESFASYLMAMGLEEPPKLVRDYVDGNQYHNIDGYKAWAAAAPQRKWEQFEASFAKAPTSYANADAWENALYDSVPGFTLFASGIAKATNSAAMLANLEQAAKKAGPLLAQFVRAFVGKKLGKDATQAARNARLLSALPHRDQEDDALLRNLRLALLRVAIDTGDAAAEANHRKLTAEYPDAPVLSFMGVEIVDAKEGPEAAAKATLAAVEALSRDDLVYRKAFFQVTGNEAQSWSAARPVDGYCLLRSALDLYREQNYDDGVFDWSETALTRDPFYTSLEKLFGQAPDELARRLAEAQVELDVAGTLRRASDAELPQLLRKDHFGISRQIALRLIADPQRHHADLLKVYDWFREDEAHRKNLLKIYWPAIAMRPHLVTHKKFWPDLGWFFDKYPESTPVLIKETFGILNERGLYKVVLDATKKLDASMVVACFLSIHKAIAGIGDASVGVALLQKILKKTKPKKPEYVLIASNLAVLHIHAGDLKAAEAVFDELFAQDFSRFEPAPEDDENEDDDFLNELMGGDLDGDIIKVFNQYFASAKFNVACLYAKTDRADQAVSALEDARRRHPGPYDRAKLDGEHDFDPIRKHPRFVALLNTIGADS